MSRKPTILGTGLLKPTPHRCGSCTGNIFLYIFYNIAAPSLFGEQGPRLLFLFFVPAQGIPLGQPAGKQEMGQLFPIFQVDAADFHDFIQPVDRVLRCRNSFRRPGPWNSRTVYTLAAFGTARYRGGGRGPPGFYTWSVQKPCGLRVRYGWPWQTALRHRNRSPAAGGPPGGSGAPPPGRCRSKAAAGSAA